MKFRLPGAIALASAIALAGCATMQDTPTKEAVAAVTAVAASPQAIANAQRLAGAPGSTQAQPPLPPASLLRTFAEVTRDAQEMPGLFNVWRKDDKVWIELTPEQLEHMYFFSTNLDQGIGESRFLAGSMSSSLSRRFGGPAIVVFRKVGPNVQLVARNVKYTAQLGTPEALAVAAAFSDSLLSTAPIVSQPHPDRKSILVEANALFFADLPGAAARLEQAYRQGYAFDSRNSSFRDVQSAPDFASFTVTAHYALARVMIPQPGTPEPPSTLPDIRSLFLGYHYSLAKLPDTPMKPRAADTRIGYFGTDLWDFTTDDRRIPIMHYVNRWRLEKKDPTAALSEPKQPIVYWIDRTVPVKYRDAIREGVLEWNKAFEKIGYKNAIKVEVQPEDAKFNTSDIRHASIRWMTTARSSFSAIGPTVVDPRSGEILDADIGIDATSFRAFKSLGSESIPQRPSSLANTFGDATYCTYAVEAAEHQGFAMSLLEARGELTLDGPEAEKFIQDQLRSTTMHEVGHTLGLTHNFRASTVYTDAQLADREFTKEHGIAGSVMEYNAVNIALKGEKQGEYHMSTLGAYDYWAIEYGYRELAPDQEAAELARIASRSNEPTLAFMADDELYHSGLDPRVNTFDLGNDPLAYAERQLKLGRELWALTESRSLKPGDNYALLRRNFNRGLFEVQQSAQHATKYIGGLTLHSDHAGSGRVPLEPIPASKQRAALNLLATTVFAADGFRFAPGFLSKLAITDSDIDDARVMGRSIPTVDVAVDQQVLNVQRSVLAPLLGPEVAQRLLNNELKVRDRSEALTAAELYSTLHRAIFSELATGEDIPLVRRNLQREYVSRVAMTIIRPAPTMPADARALLRADANKLRGELAAAQKRTRSSPETRAHVAESLAALDEVLKAPLVRQVL